MPTPIEPWHRIHEVFHPTDSAQDDKAALLHALRIAMAAEARLTLMRVNADGSVPSGDFPDVRAIVDRWPVRMPPGKQSMPDLRIQWHVARGDDPVRSCVQSLERNPVELIVVATHACDGKMTWMGKSVAEPLARSAGEMTLLIPEGAQGFVQPEDGGVTLKNILIPVASQPAPRPAIEAARRFMLHLPEVGGTVTVLHVGNASDLPTLQLPDVPRWTWNVVNEQGEVIETILEMADKVAADLVVMTTQGRHGFLDALRGSTTERVLRQARCPMLTMPVGSFLG